MAPCGRLRPKKTKHVLTLIAPLPSRHQLVATDSTGTPSLLCSQSTGTRIRFQERRCDRLQQRVAPGSVLRSSFAFSGTIWRHNSWINNKETLCSSRVSRVVFAGVLSGHPLGDGDIETHQVQVALAVPCPGRHLFLQIQLFRRRIAEVVSPSSTRVSFVLTYFLSIRTGIFI